MDLHKVDQPYRDILVMIFEELDEGYTDTPHNGDEEVDDEDSDEDTPT
jgi:hypothetical protein